MGYNFVIAVAAGVPLSALVESRAAVAEETITADEAISSKHAGAAVAEHDGGLVFLSSDLSLLASPSPIAANLGVTVSTAGFASVSDTWVWQVDGPEERLWVWSYGEQAANAGAPLAAESGIDRLDEDTLATLLRRATGVTLDLAFLRTPCRPVSWPGAAPPR